MRNRYNNPLISGDSNIFHSWSDYIMIRLKWEYEHRKVLKELGDFTTIYGVMNNSKKYYMKFDI